MSATRKGELVMVETQSSYTMLHGPTVKSLILTPAIVVQTNVKGIVTKVRYGTGAARKIEFATQRVFTVPRERLNGKTPEEAVKLLSWFDSAEEAKAAISAL